MLALVSERILHHLLCENEGFYLNSIKYLYDKYDFLLKPFNTCPPSRMCPAVLFTFSCLAFQSSLRSATGCQDAPVTFAG